MKLQDTHLGQRLTVADLCDAIEAGLLLARRHGDFYLIDEREFSALMNRYRLGHILKSPVASASN